MLLCIFARPGFNDLDDLPNKGAFALGRTRVKHVLMQTVSRHWSLPVARSMKSIPLRRSQKALACTDKVSLQVWLNRKLPSFSFFEIDLVADELKSRIVEKRFAREPHETALRAGFEIGG